MKIALDLRAGGWLGGRYYLQNLALALGRLPAAERPELVGFGAEDAAEFGGLLATADGLPGDADVVFPNWNVPRRTAQVQLHWIPDLQHRQLRGTFPRVEWLKREVALVRFAVPAGRVIVSSESVRRHAARAYPLVAHKLRVLRFTTVVREEVTAADPLDTLSRYALEPGYVLLANQFWKHKNHAVAFAAARQLELTLVCTGATDDHRDPDYFARVTHDLPPNVRILGVVPRDDYLQLVRGAAAVLQPSRFEGWSSIVEDARSFGKPVALSDIPVHREQRPPGAHYFAPSDPVALARALEAAVAAEPVPELEALTAQSTRAETYGRAFAALAAEAHAARRRR